MKYFGMFLLLVSTLLSADTQWSNDYEVALKKAQKEHKSVYMLITSESCKWCQKFENTTLANEGVMQKLGAKYVLLHINRDKDSLPKKYKSKRVPRHYFITPKGEVIYTFLGYWDVQDFSSFIDDVDVEYKRKFKGEK